MDQITDGTSLVGSSYAGTAHARSSLGDTSVAALDRAMMQRCIALGLRSGKLGEYPYGAVICRGGEFVCESINPVTRDGDVTHHAEMVAISDAQKRLDRISLEDCTIYSNAEPCALCSYAMRESRIGRVVFAMPAPITGGLSRWNILADTALSDTLPEVFAPPPEIVAGFMREEAEDALARWNPATWAFMRSRNFIGGPVSDESAARADVQRPNGVRLWLMAVLRRQFFDHFGRR